MDSMKDVFQCRWCLSEIVSPVLLPCGDSVCRKHEKDLQEASWKCLLCDDFHKLTSSQHFPENKALSKMIKLEMAKLDFGPTHKEAKQQVNKLEQKNNEVKHAISEPSDYVASFTQKYINRVDLAREEMIKIIDNACDKMKGEINKFKSDCEAKIIKEASNLIELQKSVETKIETWREKLNELVVNEPLWKEIIDETKSVQEEIDSKINANAFELPLALRDVSDSVKKDAWSQLSKSLKIPEMKISDMRDKKSALVSVPQVSQIAKAESRKPINSKDFTIQGFPFFLSVQFNVFNGKMHLGAFLHSKSSHEKQTVELSWKINVYGKHYQLITQRGLCYEFKKMFGWGTLNLISIDDIMAHAAYNAEEDIVRVEVEIDEKSFKVKQVATTPS